MNKLNFLSLVCIFFVISSCSKDDGPGDGGNLEAVRSQICSNVSGPTGAYWDYSHGLPIPLTQIPLVQNPGQRFIHSQHPLLGFTLPQGYTATEVTNPQTGTLGVNVLRNDNAVVWRYVPISQTNGQVAINSVMANEINQMLAFYGINSAPEVVCTTTGVESGGTFISQFGARLVRFGGITGLVWANVHFSPSLGVTFIAVSVSAAPTNEFDREVVDTFLPISWQLLVDLDRGNDVEDKDNDGVPSNVDPDDNNPNVPG